ncbi:MAG TPA: type I DNA topoisomerase [Candidatus Limnocylindrales bacterium]|nr:type I DNA topoisomerase [Candidatus Limnocylindrales bacterium]
MAKRSLVVVESPTKVKTIQKYLDASFVVKASMGHVRDLPKSKLGVDPTKKFKLVYTVLPAKKKVLDELKKVAAKSDHLYIATDPDREGEAIGWHLAEELGISKAKTHRILFNEITPRAVRAAFEHPGKIDRNKVDAQQARRVLDRLVGYKLSPLLWEKIRRGLSAGRVQSVAVRLITEREREVLAFVPVEYWSLHAKLRAKSLPEFEATLREVGGEKASLPNEAKTMAVMTALHGAAWRVKSVTRGERKKNPAAPFITSTLLQEGGRRLHFTAKKTMMLAQQLYEGVELGDEGSVGLITYMRTDAVRVSQEAQAEAREWVTARLGPEYLPPTPPAYRAKKSAQDAHEAIRPTAVAREPKVVARFLTKDQLALYRVIWERFLASQMLPAIYDTMAADVEAGVCLFRAQGATLRFAGFTGVYVESRDEAPAAEEESEAPLPPLVEGETLKLRALDPKQHFTQPPPRFTEASLVKALEERGIGRPSTYAQILSTIQDREYVRREKATLFPTELGMQVNDMLVPHFPEVMDVEFTAQLEESLDKIEDGDANWVETVAAFYKEFSKDLARAGRKMDDFKEGVKTDETCPECGKGLVEKWGRFGKFIACSAYPECKFTKEVAGGRERPADEPWDESCPTCAKPMVVKHGRFGKFIACSGYPECKTTKPVPIGVGCPQEGCGGQLVERRSRRGRTFYSCANYPTCTYSLWTRPIPDPCPSCGAAFVTERIARGGKRTRACVREGCGYKEELAPSVA